MVADAGPQNDDRITGGHMSDTRVPDHAVPEYRVLVDGDVEDYSTRTDTEQRTAQAALKRILDGAAMAAGLNPRAWLRQYSGDGIYSALPLGTDVTRLMDAFVRHLDARLSSYNRLRAEPAWTRIRLRMAVHIGPIRVDGATGWTGRHAVQPGRLRDSAPIRAAMAAFPYADLGVIVSSEIYNDYIAQGPGEPRPNLFRQVRVIAKKQDYTAYLYVPGFDVTGLRALAAYDPPDRTDRTDDARGTDNVRGPAPTADAPLPPSGIHGRNVNVAYGGGDAIGGHKVGRDLNLHGDRGHGGHHDAR
ncbi:hypothetical protein Acsp03_03570 [Actinomadura sp. NBRC 104412]|uniref:hypothetical protein n=1 Tax=Actinomadura sp. NBRC 104412 TaxID=3032203 RepID=UPI0024A23F41|nr:hypothetical protein [Actinomadura sp. NBRC 104412]GLZ02890.1 hypothetical protein Acsp03_03570 [Actinomadura sp. NBRC 104412]